MTQGLKPCHFKTTASNPNAIALLDTVHSLAIPEGTEVAADVLLEDARSLHIKDFKVERLLLSFSCICSPHGAWLPQRVFEPGTLRLVIEMMLNPADERLRARRYTPCLEYHSVESWEVEDWMTQAFGRGLTVPWLSLW